MQGSWHRNPGVIVPIASELSEEENVDGP
jgi:hypothetical protein